MISSHFLKIAVRAFRAYTIRGARVPMPKALAAVRTFCEYSILHTYRKITEKKLRTVQNGVEIA